MAKGNMLLGYASGPIGDVVFKRVKGQQVSVPRVRKPANPRSAKQSIQRGRFAAAVKFFTRGNQNLFKFAFENKRQVESDYNAFMRENVRRAPAITKEAFGNYDYPVFAPFVMTHGTLPTLDNTISSGKAIVYLGVDAPSTLPTTVGELTSTLVESDAFMAGDILTLVTINSSFDGTYPSASGVGSGKPQWDIKQVILSAGSTETLADTLGMQAVNADGKLQLTDATGVTLLSGTYAAFVMVHSRNTAGGLKVSTQELVLNDAATTAYDASFAPDYKSEVIASWQADGTVDAQPEAILQGSIAYDESGSSIPTMTGKKANNSPFDALETDPPYMFRFGSPDLTHSQTPTVGIISGAEGNVAAFTAAIAMGDDDVTFTFDEGDEGDVIMRISSIDFTEAQDYVYNVLYNGTPVGQVEFGVVS